jgi:hypothetical protein
MKFDEREIMEGAWHELPPTIEGVVGDKHKKKRVCNECIFTVVVAILCLLSLWYLYNYFYGVRRVMAPSSGIEGYPPILKSGVKYVMSSEHIDEMGRDRIVLCQLQLINPQATLILSWDMEDPTKIVYRNLSNRYIKVEKIEVEPIRNGYRVFWYFVIKPGWPPCDNLGFAANVKDESGREYGWDDVVYPGVKSR